MADLFPALALGDCLDEAQATIINMKVGTAVTKGQVVQASTHTVGELCSVEPGANGSGVVVGIALKSGEAGDLIPVLFKGDIDIPHLRAVTESGYLVDARKENVDLKAKVADTEKKLNEAKTETLTLAKTVEALMPPNEGLRYFNPAAVRFVESVKRTLLSFKESK